MVSLIVSTMIMMALPYIFTGITVSGLGAALAAAIVLGIANALIKPIVSILALPLTILTMGLFSFVVSGAMLLLTSRFVSGFYVDGWWTATLAAVIISLVNGAVSKRKDVAI